MSTGLAGSATPGSLLSRAFLFQGLDDGLLERIAGFAVIKRYADGQMLFAKGDEAEGLFAVVSGQVGISAFSAAGKEILLNLLGPGDVFGEIALLDGRSRTANATARGALTVVLLRRGAFLPLLDTEPKLASHLIALLCDRLRWLSGAVEDAAFLDLEGRLAKRLLLLADLYGEPTAEGVRISIRVSQQELAQLVDGSREKVNRRLQTLRQQGTIRLDKGHVIIKDPGILERLANDADAV